MFGPHRLKNLCCATLVAVLATSPSQAGDAAAPPSAPVLKRQQALVKGLLVKEISSSVFAGKASQMNATATPLAVPQSPSLLYFNQEVGDDMTTALREVRKHLTVRHGGWPVGYDIQLAFEDKYGAKDGPSAALACAVMLESLITGLEIDPALALTGDLNADGSIQPVGGVADKIRGAAARECTLVGIPKGNEPAISDLLALEGIAPFLGPQLLTLSRLDDALALAPAVRSPALARAIADFTSVQIVLKNRGLPSLANPYVKDRLASIVAAAPNHLSARLLLQVSLKQAPQFLTLRGSMDQIDQTAEAIFKASCTRQTDVLAPNELDKALKRFVLLRPKLEPRVRRYADSACELGHILLRFQKTPPRTPAAQSEYAASLKGAASQVDTELDLLRTDRAVADELFK